MIGESPAAIAIFPITVPIAIFSAIGTVNAVNVGMFSFIRLFIEILTSVPTLLPTLLVAIAVRLYSV